MLVVISDLHMEEEASHTIPGTGEHPSLTFSRNLSPAAYTKVIADLAQEARRNQAREMNLVLAGDILDITRTKLWLRTDPPLRPAVPRGAVSGALEQQILAILDSIAAEPPVKKALAAFRLLAAGSYWDGHQKRDFPVPVTLDFIPGNHDRLANATPAIRRKVRSLLGLPATAEPFHHTLFFPRERTLVRHGHEYDRFNFAADLGDEGTIAQHLPEEWYDRPPLGDFITVDVAARLPVLMRARFGDETILADRLLQAIYRRSIEFDDLRPQSAMLPYLLTMPERRVSPETVWSAIEAVVVDLIELVYDDPFLNGWLKEMDQTWHLDVVDAIQAALELRAWRWSGLPLPMAQFLSRRALSESSRESHPERYAGREAMVRQGKARFLIAGHTHRPKMALLANDELGERYYIDTGTWRHRVMANAPDYTAFGRLKALTYVVVYGPDEDLGGLAPGAKVASVDTWSGLSQRW